ncbi:Hsp20/alpha crystallin family protein [Pelagicoccus sp. SDUM812003]|uniref:Hsp20/alpha crystallin family protein n=1 Tax=Pelagicoccus sp. SDUM812003 TaxID=3041267 RepID=UPI00280C5AA2|nr:Hsp20/alpha crystallin family protein [Pelagicoccus sp. SDUM812003]MDQ8202750.1 Hsp20/alpha crystallin family protein [Pelagicoccus sp. SDUM812003]
MTFLNIVKKNKASNASQRGAATAVRYVRPRYRIHETDTGYQAQVDLPGVSRKGLEVNVQDGALEIVASRDWTAPETWRQLGGSSEQGLSYRLRLAIGEEIDSEGIKAEVANGVLHLALPKSEAQQPRRIAIN